MQDHRLAMVGAGVVTLLLSIALFGTLPQSFFPPQNDDYSRVNIILPPGSTLEANRSGDRPGRGDRVQGPERPARVRARATSAPGE